MALHEPTFSDLQEAQKRFGRVLAQAKASATYTATLDQELKLLLRCFFVFVEGTTTLMREAVTTPALVPPALIPAKDRHELLRSDAASATGTYRPRRTAMAQRVKLTLKYFPLAFGSDYQASFNPPGWPAFVRLVKLRNRITHPVRIQDLFPAEALTAFQPAADWFLTELQREISLAIDSLLSGTMPQPHSRSPRLVFPEIAPAESVFDNAFYDSVELSGASSIAYIRAAHGLLHDELRFSLGLISGSPAEVASGEHGAEFELRCAVRSAVSVLEGLAGMALLFTRAAVRRGEVVLGDDALVAAERDPDLLRQLRTCLELFSAHFGAGHLISTETGRWRRLKRLIAQRHRLTHPRSPSDLEVSAETVDDLIALLDSFAEDISKAVYLD